MEHSLHSNRPVVPFYHDVVKGTRLVGWQESSVSDIMQAEKSWVSQLHNPKRATIGQGTAQSEVWSSPSLPLPDSSLGL